MNPTDFLVAGVGGQGTLLASNILAEVGLRAGYDVKRAEVHGMAQRGGSVSSHVRWGSHVRSPLVGVGEVDILIALERVEALRYIDFLRPNGKVLVNDLAIIPVTVTTGGATYPNWSDILHAIEQVTANVELIPATRTAEDLGNARAGNVVMLGALSRHLAVDVALWVQVISERVPARYRDLNLEAFERGRSD